jgi:hypothetical protein
MMRAQFILLPLSLVAAPVCAQTAPPAEPSAIAMPPELTDPAAGDRLADAMQSLSDAFLDFRIGDVQAALEGRQPTSADRRRTIASESGMNGRELRARVAAVKPMIAESVKAVQQSLPAVMQGLAQAQRSLERAVANMPDPNYPRR